ncbi:hypothetical protein P389DRAFT_33322 [Cystobasidium minutum MCA 4210]|uniref:uncharacterized protein n=1 Tax=Cystobasidium minutum MCA 4210 TaxID=1397322 RepID=UPI0034CE5FE1|eukprot:jgi/Rhomi1/33322/CE33321_295
MRISQSLFKRVLSVQESNAAREWIQQFKLKGGLTPPKHADDYEVSYSRSSGPGGQNVNKVNTKATIRLDLGRAKRWLPEHALEELRDSSIYAKSSDSVVLSSMRHRTQAENTQDCLEKLEDTLISAVESGLQGETSHDKREHVKTLIRIDKERTKSQKQRHSQVKAGRSKASYE